MKSDDQRMTWTERFEEAYRGTREIVGKVWPYVVVGIAIALMQALTQVQEVTLTFIPKIVAILVMIIIAGPFIGGQIYSLTVLIYGRIEHGF